MPCLPSSFDRLEGSLSALPFYRNCFVCGVDRKPPGAEEKVSICSTPPGKIGLSFPVPVSMPADRDTVHRFERDGRVHPVVLMALVDETMGWAGFMNYASGAVTVRLSATLHRGIGVDEKLVVFGRGRKPAGRAPGCSSGPPAGSPSWGKRVPSRSS